MTVPRFVDTNVLIYALETDPTNAGKAAQARRILEATDLVVSAQVLGEFYVQATRSSRPGALSHDQATRFITALHRFPVQPVTAATVRAALTTKIRFGTSYWDALIIEAARAGGCDEVLSEDLAAGQEYAGIVVRNPFGSADG